MTIETAFDIGQQVRAKDGDIGEVVSIWIEKHRADEHSCICYAVDHYREVTGDAEYSGTYYESELEAT